MHVLINYQNLTAPQLALAFVINNNSFRTSGKAIGSSRFKVFEGPVDWGTAHLKCLSEKLEYPALSKTFYGHLAYDKNEKIHAFLRKEHKRLGLSCCKILRRAVLSSGPAPAVPFVNLRQKAFFLQVRGK